MYSKVELSSPASYQDQLKALHYNQVMKYGNMIECSGQGEWSITEDGLGFTYTSLKEEIDQAFKNIEYVLNSAGASWKNVYKANSYHVNFKNTTDLMTTMFPKLHRKYMGEDNAPIWTCVGVTALGDKGMNVEVQVTAIFD
ncbi:MAG: Endoribonuclease L-PSP/chorismate mutase-like protein [Benjaminiella poitrasii]|nr:MAG: Endoribonuclease L-PSP/chorismate mutase-like protein [Benjaminiella poitrasii]